MLPIPDHLKLAMKMFREGWDSLPQGYIEHHAELAKADIQKQDITILEDHGLVPDGWCDGMRVQQYTIAHKTDGKWKTDVIQWHDSGAWFVKCSGWSRFLEMKS